MDLRTPRDADGPLQSLVRPTDRARRALRRAQLVLGALAVAVAVPAGLAAAEQPAPALAAGVVVVQAELLEPGPAPELAVVGSAVPTPARWSVPGGGTRTGLLWAEAGLDRGASVTVTVDAAGRLVDADAGTEDPRTTGILAGIGVLLCCWAVLAAVSAGWRSRLAALDSSRWAADWARVEPVWSGRPG